MEPINDSLFQFNGEVGIWSGPKCTGMTLLETGLMQKTEFPTTRFPCCPECLLTSDREEAKGSLVTMISDTTFEASKRTFKTAQINYKTDLISFIATTIEGGSSVDTAVQILKDDMFNPPFDIDTGLLF
ncbi:hypothetical protein MITS9509_00146 [Synechococcus sp. MIT S9509]|nr:hypothetical protein MITS9504_01319 [Synechococcus sp. MIT S9504]KZR93556.1 hypothetical protein MITS9509_00146 [Synechococcus sp. MIT S9509]